LESNQSCVISLCLRRISLDNGITLGSNYENNSRLQNLGSFSLGNFTFDVLHYMNGRASNRRQSETSLIESFARTVGRKQFDLFHLGSSKIGWSTQSKIFD